VVDFYFLWQVIGYNFGGSQGTFNLPNAAGTVPAVVGQGYDANLSTFTFRLGQQVGEYVHTLSIDELASHNHGVANGTQNASNNLTSNEYTGVSVNISTTGVSDSGHAHGYTATNNNNHDNATSLTTSQNNSGVYGATTESARANIVDPGHRHSITDPTHHHTLHSAGGDKFHNNVQPSLPVGNLFIYSGKPNYGSYPNANGNIYN
jgi:microcystin-dependent protein